MAADIKENLGIAAELIGGSAGIFDVAVDGIVVFSRHEQGRFPNDGEIVEKIR